MTVHRYHRQTLLEGIGTEGQERLRSASVLVAGVGALGCAVADHLVRAGIGHLRLIDRDLVEPTNLQRQCLFAEDDVDRPKPPRPPPGSKPSTTKCNWMWWWMTSVPAVANDMIAGCDAIADGLDNFATRFLLNDLSVKFGLPYAYGGGWLRRHRRIAEAVAYASEATHHTGNLGTGIRAMPALPRSRCPASPPHPNLRQRWGVGSSGGRGGWPPSRRVDSISREQ